MHVLVIHVGPGRLSDRCSYSFLLALHQLTGQLTQILLTCIFCRYQGKYGKTRWRLYCRRVQSWGYIDTKWSWQSAKLSSTGKGYMYRHCVLVLLLTCIHVSCRYQGKYGRARERQSWGFIATKWPQQSAKLSSTEKGYIYRCCVFVLDNLVNKTKCKQHWCWSVLWLTDGIALFLAGSRNTICVGQISVKV